MIVLFLAVLSIVYAQNSMTIARILLVDYSFVESDVYARAEKNDVVVEPARAGSPKIVVDMDNARNQMELSVPGTGFVAEGNLPATTRLRVRMGADSVREKKKKEKVFFLNGLDSLLKGNASEHWHSGTNWSRWLSLCGVGRLLGRHFVSHSACVSGAECRLAARGADAQSQRRRAAADDARCHCRRNGGVFDA